MTKATWHVETNNDWYLRCEWDGGDTVEIMTPVGGQWVCFDTFTSLNMGTTYEAIEQTQEYIDEMVREAIAEEEAWGPGTEMDMYGDNACDFDFD